MTGVDGTRARPRDEIVQRGLYYEEFEVGARYLHRPGRTATEADNVLFSSLTMNTQALHLDAAFSADAAVRAAAHELDVDARDDGRGIRHADHAGHARRAARPDRHRVPAPLFHGDTLYTETEVLEKRRSASRPGQGIVTHAPHRPQPGRRRRRHRDARRAHVVRADRGAGARHGVGIVSRFRPRPRAAVLPADRPERFAKALERADAVILDLEDAVAPAAKTAARGALIESELDPARVIVRVNPPGTDDFAADLATLSQTDYRRSWSPRPSRRSGSRRSTAASR